MSRVPVRLRALGLEPLVDRTTGGNKPFREIVFPAIHLTKIFNVMDMLQNTWWSTQVADIPACKLLAQWEFQVFIIVFINILGYLHFQASPDENSYVLYRNRFYSNIIRNDT